MTVMCPSCGAGTLHATFQHLVTWTTDPDGALAHVGEDEPSSDAFVAAWCDDDDCRDELAQEPGDGRLRRAGLIRDDDPDWVADDQLTAAWIRAVATMIGEYENADDTPED